MNKRSSSAIPILFVLAQLLCVAYSSFAQSNDVARYIENLESSTTSKGFTAEFEKMIGDFKKGRLKFSDDEVSRIVKIARDKSYSDSLLARVYAWAGTMFGDGRMDQALLFFMESADLYERRGKKLAQALSYFEIALIHHKAENYSDAGTYYQDALAVAGDSLDYRTKINCYNGLALILRSSGKLDSALFDFQKAHEVAKANYDTVWTAILLGNIGSIYLRKGNYDSSLWCYQKNLKLIRNTGEFENEIETYAHLGKVYLHKKDYRLSKIYLDSAVWVINDRKIHFNDFFNPNDYIAENYAALYAAMGDYKKALAYHKEFHEIAQRKQANINGRNLKQLQSAYDFEQQQKDLELLQKINEANMLSIKQQRYIGIGFFFIIILLVILMMIVYKNSRQRKRLNHQLSRSNSELARLNTVKDKLFTVISHDLRTPLINLHSMLHLLRDDNMGQQEFKIFTDKIGSQLGASMAVLDNLLTWAKSQLSSTPVEFKRVLLYEVVEDIIKQFAKELEFKRISVTNNLQHDLIANADPDQVLIIVRNILGNAIKFTPPGGLITVKGSNGNDVVKVEVQDTGVGIPKEKIDQLFDPEKHFSTSGTNQEKGAGIGLLITKEMVKNNGGTLLLASEHQQGTTVTLTLPAENGKER